MEFSLHGFEPASRANGPGLRAVVWFQGCTLNCSGCFNPATHDPAGGRLEDTAEIAAEIRAQEPHTEGITVSGGEPFQQPAALLDLLARFEGEDLGRIVFTGYTIAEVRDMPLGATILSHVDALIAGRYVASRHLAHGLLGSANKQIHLLTPRYTASDFLAVPAREVILHTDGTVTMSGIDPLKADNQQDLG